MYRSCKSWNPLNLHGFMDHLMSIPHCSWVLKSSVDCSFGGRIPHLFLGCFSWTQWAIRSIPVFLDYSILSFYCWQVLATYPMSETQTPTSLGQFPMFFEQPHFRGSENLPPDRCLRGHLKAAGATLRAGLQFAWSVVDLILSDFRDVDFNQTKVDYVDYVDFTTKQVDLARICGFDQLPLGF